MKSWEMGRGRMSRSYFKMVGTGKGHTGRNPTKPNLYLRNQDPGLSANCAVPNPFQHLNPAPDLHDRAYDFEVSEQAISPLQSKAGAADLKRAWFSCWVNCTLDADGVISEQGLKDSNKRINLQSNRWMNLLVMVAFIFCLSFVCNLCKKPKSEVGPFPPNRALGIDY